MSIPLKRVVLSTSALAIVAGPSIVAAQAATRHGGTTAKTTGDDNGQDTRSASLWFNRALDGHRGERLADHTGDDTEGGTPTTRQSRPGTSNPGSDHESNDDSTTTSGDPTTVTTLGSRPGGLTTTTRAPTTTTAGSTSTTRATTTSSRTTSTSRPTTTRPATSTTLGTTTTTRATTTSTAAGTTTTTRPTTTSSSPTTTTTTRAAATMRLSQTFLATAIGNPIQLSTSISNDGTTPAAITLTINLTTTGALPGYLNPSSKPSYLSCSPSEIQNPSTTGTFTCTGSVPAATTGAVVVSSGSMIKGTAGTPVSSTASAAGVNASASSTYS